MSILCIIPGSALINSKTPTGGRLTRRRRTIEVPAATLQVQVTAFAVADSMVVRAIPPTSPAGMTCWSALREVSSCTAAESREREQDTHIDSVGSRSSTESQTSRTALHYDGGSVDLLSEGDRSAERAEQDEGDELEHVVVLRRWRRLERFLRAAEAR